MTSPPPQTMTARVAFVVNGTPESAMGQRAREFARRLPGCDIQCCYRAGWKGLAALRLWRELVAFRPAVCCVFDHGLDGVLATAAYCRIHRIPWILDTGDNIVALGIALGRTGASRIATQWLDTFGERSADHIVVRGRGHHDAYAARGIAATWIPDGVDVEQFAAKSLPDEPSATNPLVIGLIGSSQWNGPTVMFYGQELIDVACDLASRNDFPFPVRGLMIGDGSGIPVLQQRLRDRGLEHLVTFLGRRNYDDLPSLLASMHVCLSTQTDDDVGAVRTTGKLPLYLAAGRFVLASRVGEAARILPPAMLVPYDGTNDTAYASRVAERVRSLVRSKTSFRHRQECVDLAQANFDYDALARRYSEIVDELLNART